MSIDKIFDALASAPRRKILALLNSTELTTSSLAEQLAITTPAISRHLSVLENAGLVSGKRRGQFVYYRLNADHLAHHLSGFLFGLRSTAAPLERTPAGLAKQGEPD